MRPARPRVRTIRYDLEGSAHKAEVAFIPGAEPELLSADIRNAAGQPVEINPKHEAAIIAALPRR